MVKAGYKQTEIGVIPEDWKVVTIEEIAFVVGGGTPKTNINYYWADDINWFTPTEIGNSKYISESIRKISIDGLKNSSAKLLPKGTILLTTRASIGDTAILLNEATTNQGFQSLIIGEGNLTEFIYYLIDTIRSQLIQNASGSTFLEISPNKVKNIQIPLPPLSEQEAIAEALSDTDIWIESLEQLIAKKRLIKQGAMQELLTPKEDWRLKNIILICDNIIDYRGVTPKKLGMYWGDGDIVALSAGNVKKGYIDFNTECYLGSESLYKRWMRNGDPKKGDIVFTLEAPLGNIALIPDNKKYILSQRTILLQLNEKYSSKYIFQLMLSSKFQKYISESATGSTAQGIKRQTFEKLLIQIPSLPEQLRIATILSDMDAELEALETQLSKARQIKQGMMQELLTGRIRLV